MPTVIARKNGLVQGLFPAFADFIVLVILTSAPEYKQ
jgi:hypothetical protein